MCLPAFLDCCRSLTAPALAQCCAIGGHCCSAPGHRRWQPAGADRLLLLLLALLLHQVLR